MTEKIVFLLLSRSALTRTEIEDSIDFEVEMEDGIFQHQYSKEEIKKVQSLDPHGFVDDLLNDIQTMLASYDQNNMPQKKLMA